MVAKDIILKHLDEVIKSHQHLTIQNEKLIKSLNKFAKSTKNRKTEKMIILNNNGETVFTNNGSKYHASCNVPLIKLHGDNGELHLEHNHPSPYGDALFYTECLSTGDMSNIKTRIPIHAEEVYPFKSVTVEGQNGTRMTLVRGDYFKPYNHTQFDEAVSEYKKFYEEYYHHKLYDTASEILHKLVEESRKEFGTEETIMKTSDLNRQSKELAVKKIGRFEDQKEFKKIEKLFRDANCKLIIDSWK